MVLRYSASSAVVYFDDPISVGIGARPLSMGKAFVALADDPNAMFLNPAGLGTQKNWDITSMNSNFLNEYQYSMFCGVDPTPIGVVGIGYVSSRIADIDKYSDHDSFEGTADFYNDALVLSYGNYVGDIAAKYVPFIKGRPDLYGGASLKFYSLGYSGNVEASGSGYNLDLGLKYNQEDWLSYGLNFQNVLAGSKISGDFEQEDMPFLTKIGVLFRWLEHDVNVALDKDMFLGRDNVPWPMHFGVEWNLHPNLSLRAGADQVASSANNGNLVNNTTFGLGLNYKGVKVDLAYVQNYAETNLASNVISLSLFSQPEFFMNQPPQAKPAPAPVAAPAPVTLTIVQRAEELAKKVKFSPAANLATIAPEQYFSGTAESGVIDISLAGKNLALNIGTFEGSVPLKIGENEITLKVRDAVSTEAILIRRVIRFYAPSDIPKDEALKKPFEYLAVCTKVHNYYGKDYAMKNPVTREIAAIILAKAKKLDTSKPLAKVFKDVTKYRWSAGFIGAVDSAGFMEGYSDGTFKPSQTVTLNELTQVMKKASPDMDKVWLDQYLSSRPKDNATMGDLIEMIYQSGMLGSEIDGFKKYIGPVTH